MADVRSKVGRDVRRRLPISGSCKPPCRWFPSCDAGLARRGAGTNQHAILVSAANAASCLPPNGYMDSDTTITIHLYRRATGREVNTDAPRSRLWSHFQEAPNWCLHDRERPTAQPMAANARRRGLRSAASSPRHDQFGQRDCLGWKARHRMCASVSITGAGRMDGRSRWRYSVTTARCKCYNRRCMRACTQHGIG